MPYFISLTIIIGILADLVSTNGVINQMLRHFGIPPSDFMMKNSAFRTLYISSGIWQSFGYNAIVYLAALSGIDPTLYEAATVDGANRWQRIRHIDLPMILPTACILLILRAGNIMNVGFEKVYLMQNNLNLSASEVISTYVYKIGIISAQYSYSSAINLFNTLVNLALLIIVNHFSRKFNETSLW